MYYWIVFKNGVYLSDVDGDGNFTHTNNESEAMRFQNFHYAFGFLKHGYSLVKKEL